MDRLNRLPHIAISLLLLSNSVLCQKKQTEAFTDPTTGIAFQRFFGAKTSFAFGIALPENVTNSFIGQLSFPLNNGAGWGGWSLTGDMEGPLLMAAWSDGTNVVSSFRQAFNEDDNPPEVSGTFTVRPIAQGTLVNDTHLQYTFLCEGCLDAQFGLEAADTAATFEMGWAMASTPVQNPETSAGVLAFHNSGFGGFDAHLDLAKITDFDTFAAMAGAPLTASTGAQPISANAGDEDDDEDDEGGGGGGGDDGDVSDDND
ncbi:CBD9-like protein [Hypoxylon fuscum]|nr:CBD9-like protein [Hypoxylon fuscum]